MYTNQLTWHLTGCMRERERERVVEASLNIYIYCYFLICFLAYMTAELDKISLTQQPLDFQSHNANINYKCFNEIYCFQKLYLVMHSLIDLKNYLLIKKDHFKL